MKTIIILSVVIVSLSFNACTGKEINSRVNDFTTDVGNVIEGGVDKSEETK